MKKQILPLLGVFVLTLSGCESGLFAKEENVKTFSVGVIGSAVGDIRYVSDDSGTVTVLSPFNTSISASLYYYKGDYTDEEIQEIQDILNSTMQYTYALSDRHYDYTMDGDAKKPIVNVKAINDAPRDTPIVVDPFLFDLLKESYEFSLETYDDSGNLLFNIFTGKLNTYYEEKLANLTFGESALNKTLRLANNLRFSSDVDFDTINGILAETPITKEEVEGLLTFDESTSSITFHTFVNKEGKEIDDVEISLSAVSKGFATELLSDRLQEKWPDISFLLNSGSSSVKAIGNRPDGKSWSIRITNPLYREVASEDTGKLNSYEVSFDLLGAFSLSTSGYYENYFYVYDPEEDHYLRRDHILYPATGVSNAFFDQVSIFNDDAGYADMYTTTLMLARSLEEAEELLERLDKAFSLDSDAVLLFKSKAENPLELFQYASSQLTDLNEDGLPKALVSDGLSSQESVYDGDYSDLPAGQVVSSLSQVDPDKRDFRETYWISADVFDSFSIIQDDKTVVYPEDVKAVLVKGE